jgi:hypothetical protein
MQFNKLYTNQRIETKVYTTKEEQNNNDDDNISYVSIVVTELHYYIYEIYLLKFILIILLLFYSCVYLFRTMFRSVLSLFIHRRFIHNTKFRKSARHLVVDSIYVIMYQCVK